jgi:hypothetical protein
MRHALPFALFLGALSLTGCSGGSSDSLPSVRIRCSGGQSFCIISCDLGCSQTGCSVTEIAENQRLRFKFSDRVDPASVNGAAISIRTAAGVAPDGEFLVQDNEVTFVPTVRVTAGISTFGFRRNESYIITLAGGPSSAFGVRNLSGSRLSSEFTCSVVASRGILDEDQQPPTVTLVSPTNLTNAPTNPTIVLRFSELIDTTPLQLPLSPSSPIRVVLRGQLPGGVCDRDAEGIALEGLPQLSSERVGDREVTVVTFQSASQLPGLSCLTVSVTADLRDLSGRQAVPASWEILTEAGTSSPITITETFANASGQDPLTSGGIWSSGARPGVLGGDGRHGSFNPALGTSIGGGTFEWDLDSTFVIPASQSLTGQEYQVTDGRFYFTDFNLDAGTTVRFVGSVPPVIFVRGEANVRGTIELNGADLPFWVPSSGAAIGQRVTTFNARGATTTPAPFINGQPGTRGGAGGGRGGNGANECQGTGPIIVSGVTLTNGQPGAPVQLPAGHAYAASGLPTSGVGSVLQPSNGISSNAVVVSSIYRAQVSPGGSGGGYWTAGAAPSFTVPIVTPPWPTTGIGPLAAAGQAFPLLPYPASPPTGYSSLNHFLVGGSGGGGGGSHQLGTFALATNVDQFMAGHAGTGGGGAFALRAGGAVTIFATALLQARGGDGVFINGSDTSGTVNLNFGISSPGGGGSGGSFLIQSGRDLTVAGTVDARGGTGSRTDFITTPATLNIRLTGGNGSPGFYRLEANGLTTFTGTGTPAFSVANNVGPLADRDPVSGDTSVWRGTGLVFPPTWLRYELDVDTDGNGTIDVTYTDSGAPGTSKANDPTGPVTILFQGARLNQAGTTPVPGTIKQWREGVGNGAGPGISLDSVNGFRFQLLYNRQSFPNVVVRGLRVFART